MTDNKFVICRRDTFLENLAAELTRAAFSQVLCHGMRGLWITLELDLWRVVEETVKNWAQKWPPGDSWGPDLPVYCREKRGLFIFWSPFGNLPKGVFPLWDFLADGQISPLLLGALFESFMFCD